MKLRRPARPLSDRIALVAVALAAPLSTLLLLAWASSDARDGLRTAVAMLRSADPARAAELQAAQAAGAPDAAAPQPIPDPAPDGAAPAGR